VNKSAFREKCGLSSEAFHPKNGKQQLHALLSEKAKKTLRKGYTTWSAMLRQFVQHRRMENTHPLKE